MSKKISAYLSIYDDWDILPDMLKSISSLVDELVVVDGAYTWMGSYLTAIGKNPLRSSSKVYEIIAGSGIRTRFIARTWENEIEKREAGYAACSNRYVLRVDADEIFFFDEPTVEQFLSDGEVMAQMEIPTAVTPEWVLVQQFPTQNEPVIPRLSVLFDREKISPAAHLRYLWLVLEAEKLSRETSEPHLNYPRSLGRIAHLTSWRRWDTAIGRAAFYVMNYFRGNGVPWLRELRNRPLANTSDLFRYITPSQFMETLLSGEIVTGNFTLGEGEKLFRGFLPEEQKQTLTGHYLRFLGGLNDNNTALTHKERTFLDGEIISIDLSTPAARASLARNGRIVLRASPSISASKVRLRTLTGAEPNWVIRDMPTEIDGQRLSIALDDACFDPGALRTILMAQMWLPAETVIGSFWVET